MTKKLIKVTCDNGVFLRSGFETIVLFENGIRNEPFEYKEWVIREEFIDERINRALELNAIFYIQVGSKIYERHETVIVKPGKRTLVKKESEVISGHDTHSLYATFLIDVCDFEEDLIKKMKESVDNFYLSESELLLEAHDIIAGKFKWHHFRTHVEIGGSIIDGLLFVGETKDHMAKIIGFEAKTDGDSYVRLHSQINSYLTICDEVYLIIESKKIPRDLPFYVGVIRVENGEAGMMRHACSLKHSIDANGNCWATLLKSASRHAGLEVSKGEFISSFFNAVENIKRKLIWNQFVLGFHQTYVKEYVQFTKEEKRIIQCYFRKEAGGLMDYGKDI